jgi:GGDEF domain-containing protein
MGDTSGTSGGAADAGERRPTAAARGRQTRISVDGLLGRVLHDPETGLPNEPFFALIRDWEERRALRRKYRVRVLTISVRGGSGSVRRSLSWRVTQALRASDLVASGGPARLRVLLTSPDAEHADRIRSRIEGLVRELPDGQHVAMDIAVEEDRRARAR